MPSATDKTKERWPNHPLWEVLLQADWGVDGVALCAPGQRALEEGGAAGREHKPGTAPKERLEVNRKQLKLMVARDGIEPPTRGFLGPVKSITY
jgi:hypothetical protein